MTPIRYHRIVTPAGLSVSVNGKISSSGLDLFQRLQNVVHVELSGEINRDVLEVIAQKFLVSLGLNNVSGETSWLQSIVGMHTLRRLALRSQTVTNDFFGKLTECVEILDVSGVSLTCDDLESIARLPKLSELSCTLSKIDGRINRQLGFPLVETIDLSGSVVGDYVVEKFVFGRNLRTASFMHSTLSNHFISSFKLRYPGVDVWESSGNAESACQSD
jgi:hypothetical protein